MVRMSYNGNGFDVKFRSMLTSGLIPPRLVSDCMHAHAGERGHDKHLNRQCDGEVVGAHNEGLEMATSWQADRRAHVTSVRRGPLADSVLFAEVWTKQICVNMYNT